MRVVLFTLRVCLRVSRDTPFFVFKLHEKSLPTPLSTVCKTKRSYQRGVLSSSLNNDAKSYWIKTTFTLLRACTGSIVPEMATVNFSVPDEVKQEFNRLFANENKSALLTRLMKDAIAEHKRQKQRVAAMDKILEITADMQPVDKKVLMQARLEGRP